MLFVFKEGVEGLQLNLQQFLLVVQGVRRVQEVMVEVDLQAQDKQVLNMQVVMVAVAQVSISILKTYK